MIPPSRIQILAAILVASLAMTASAGAAVIGRSGGLAYVSKEKTLKQAPADETSAATSVFCPKGYKALGGGASVAGPPATTFLSSNTNQTNSSWYASAYHSNAGSKTLEVFGICSKSKRIFNARALATVDAAPAVGHGTAACPSGEVISGGALFIGEDTDWFLNTTEESVSNGWEVYAQHRSGSSSSLLVDVICKAGPDPDRRSATTSLPVGATKTVKKSCPADEVAAGGGGLLGGDAGEAHILASAPYDGGDKGKVPDDGWRLKARNDVGAAKMVKVDVVCLK